ncbi:hypothetical protein LTR53_000962 [Teratosphaeriaceae sp. CCFEE 6253]|nr:hypothetical protein LTR53_000962 [Teratosphaeriaceae sp. CCFEE 6253]
MPEKWDATKDRKLLLIILELHKIDTYKVAKRYTELEGTTVTDRAVSQHLQKLAKQVGGPGGEANGGTSAAGTPKKATASHKSPSQTKSASKRGRAAMSDEDDSEAEAKMNVATASPAKRPRANRSKTPRSYTELPDPVDADDEAEVKREEGDADVFDDAEDGGGSMRNGHAALEGMDDDAVSDFNPGLELY